MLQIDFNQLPRTTRERFVRSLVSNAPGSAPICSRVLKTRRPIGSWIVLALAVIGLGLLGIPRFGSTFSPVQDRRYLGGYVAVCAALGFAVAMLARRRALAGALPFTPGAYVFPLDVVDARGREIDLYSLAELVSVEPVHNYSGGAYTHSTLWLVFPTQSFAFEARSHAESEVRFAQISEARQALASATQRGQLYQLATLDPFAEARQRNFVPVYEHGLLARDSPIWTRFVWAITIVSGLVVGVAAWRGRNWRSDERAFARLAAKPDVQLAQTYLSGGGLRVVDVKGTIVPRARLIEAKNGIGPKRADALEQFLKDYPRSSVDTEARAALADEVHAQYTAQTTVTGLRTFIARWPDSPDVPAARAKIHERFQDTLVDFRRHANVADRSVVPVVEALLAWAEERGTPLEVRFRRRTTTSLAAADTLLAKNLLDDDGPAKGGNAAASIHFSAEETTSREAVLVAGLEDGLRKVFPADVLALHLGAPLRDVPLAPVKPAPPLGDVIAPTIVVDYEVGWAGTTYVARDRLRRFIGLFVKVDVTVQVPKDARFLAFTLRVEPPDSFPVEELAASGDVRVYDAMMLRAFDRMSTKLMAVFFEPRTAAARAPEPF